MAFLSHPLVSRNGASARQEGGGAAKRLHPRFDVPDPTQVRIRYASQLQDYWALLCAAFFVMGFRERVNRREEVICSPEKLAVCCI